MKKIIEVEKVYPKGIGVPAVIIKDGKKYKTSTVIAERHNGYAEIETRNSIYRAKKPVVLVKGIMFSEINASAQVLTEKGWSATSPVVRYAEIGGNAQIETHHTIYTTFEAAI